MALTVPFVTLFFLIMTIIGYFGFVATVFIVTLSLIFTAGYASSGSFLIALLIIPVAGIFTMGWSYGYLSETVKLTKI